MSPSKEYKGELESCVKAWLSKNSNSALDSCSKVYSTFDQQNYPKDNLVFATATSILCKLGIRGRCNLASLNYSYLKMNYYYWEAMKIGCFQNKETESCSSLANLYYRGEKYSNIDFIKEQYRSKQANVENISCDGREPIKEDYLGYYIYCYRAIYQSFTQKKPNMKYLERFCKIRNYKAVSLSDQTKDMFNKELELCELHYPN